MKTFKSLLVLVTVKQVFIKKNFDSLKKLKQWRNHYRFFTGLNIIWEKESLLTSNNLFLLRSCSLSSCSCCTSCCSCFTASSLSCSCCSCSVWLWLSCLSSCCSCGPNIHSVQLMGLSDCPKQPISHTGKSIFNGFYFLTPLGCPSRQVPSGCQNQTLNIHIIIL